MAALVEAAGRKWREAQEEPVTFSVVVPTWKRWLRLERALTSLEVQTFVDFEVIVVDDGNQPEGRVQNIVNGHDSRFQCVRQKHAGRVVARNTGMEAARGDWICWLDSDDAWDAEYLHTFAWNIEQQPEANLWVCGAVVHGMIKTAEDKHVVPKWTKLRLPWMPPLNEEGDFPVHDHFPSGKVGTGMFVFRRECLDETGLLPPWRNIQELSDGIDDYLGYETGYSYAKKWVGNPWGDDHAMFRKLTMHYEVHTVEACLYVHYVR